MTTNTLLQLKSDFYRFQGEQFSSSATGGSTAKLTDSSLIGYVSETWPTKLDGVQLRMTGGSASGDLRMVGRVDRSDGDLYPNRAFSAAVASTDTYELWGTAINGGTPLTSLFNDIVRVARPVTDTQLTIVTGQRQYDVSTYAQTRRDIKGVYRRLLDPNSIEPYHLVDLRLGVDYWVYDRGSTGTPAVTLELARALTVSTTQHQLWLRSETAFSEFTDDTSTIDADYRTWLAWEAVLELVERKLSTTNADVARWQRLQSRAVDQLSSWRARWFPREPVEISTFQSATPIYTWPYCR